MNRSENDYVSLVRIPRKWFHLFVWTFSILVILNVSAELLLGWAWETLGETILTRMSVLMTLIVGWFFILSHVLEGIMLGYAKLYRDRLRAEGIEIGKAQGLEQGRVEGRAEGIRQAYQEIADWNKRRLEAEAKGIPFNEPPPVGNGTNTDLS